MILSVIEPRFSPLPRLIRGVPALTVLFVAEIFILAWLQAPYERFSRFAFADSGADLTIFDLIGRGFRPTLDFGYIYGLLPLLINRLWYGLAGPTPAAFRLAMLACDVALAWGLARFSVLQRVGASGVALILLAMPDLLLASNIVLVQALEPVLLVHALAEQARGRRDLALALVTACAFVKPSMAYSYGLILLATMVLPLTLRARGFDAWRRALAPATATGALLAILLAAVYGIRPLIHTLTPGAGLDVYRASGYGFFRGSGRDFWFRPGAGLRGYLRYEIGFWLAGSAALLFGGLEGLLRRTSGTWANDPPRNREIVATCAVLHAGFVVYFFGNRWSWIYYYAILVLGVAALTARGRRHAALVWFFALMVLVGDKARVEMIVGRWRTDSARAETLGLWASPEEREGWRKVLELTRGRRPVLLARVEGAALLVPGFEPPVGAYFAPGHPLPVEVRRKAAQLATAPMVVVAGSEFQRDLARWPEIMAALDGCVPVWEGDEFRVYRRARPPRNRRVR